MVSLVDPVRIKIAVGSLRLRGSERALMLGLPVHEPIGIGMRFVLLSFGALSRRPKIDQFRHFFIISALPEYIAPQASLARADPREGAVSVSWQTNLNSFDLLFCKSAKRDFNTRLVDCNKSKLPVRRIHEV